GHLNRSTAMQFDVAGRVVQSTDPKAQTSSFEFNSLGQPLHAYLPGETVTYGYGQNGRTESVQDNRGSTLIAYEAGSDRVSSVTDPVTGAVGYQYDLMGNRRFMSLPGGGQIEYRYNLNRWAGGDMECDKFRPLMNQLIDDQGRDVTYVYTNYGMLQEVDFDKTYSGGSVIQYAKSQYFYEATGRSHGQ